MSVVFTNINIYRAIAEEAYAEMCTIDKNNRSPKKDGSDGYILKHDPQQRSLKNAMVVIVFTSMWLEALLHQFIVNLHGAEKFKEVDRKFGYEKKLELLGINDLELLNKVKKFKESRKELVHEKAYFDVEITKIAQEEAALANEVMHEISKMLIKPTS